MKALPVSKKKIHCFIVAVLLYSLVFGHVSWAEDSKKTTKKSTGPAECTTSQYDGLNKAKAYCGKDSYACVSTPYGGCSNSPWSSAQCSTQCEVTGKAPWLDPSIPKPTGNTNRTITYTNSCDFDVWAGYTGGSIDGTPSCTSNADCGIAGAVCDTTANQCFWGIPSMTNSDNTIKRLHLPKNGSSQTVSLNNPIHQKDAATAWVKWSGNTWASTDCTGTGASMVCETATCPTGGCTPFTGPKGVLSLAEFTLQASAQDFYDISIIGGFNVPVAMQPTGGQSYAPTPAGPTQQADGLGHTVTVNPSAYWCTEPGSATATSALSACNWAPDPTTASYTKEQLRSVYPPNTTSLTACTTDKDCKNVTGGTSCGLWQDAKDKIKQVCGAPRGWWSANEVCAVDAAGTIGTQVFGCTKAVTGQGTQENLYACNGVNNTSGYAAASGITPEVCGCHDWSYPVNGHGCNGSNSEWVSIALPVAKIKKDACPTAYSFPFDDETSTFNCQTTPTPVATSGAITANVVNYTVTFCPGSLTGR